MIRGILAGVFAVFSTAPGQAQVLEPEIVSAFHDTIRMGQFEVAMGQLQ